jgi:hypothetical protein
MHPKLREIVESQCPVCGDDVFAFAKTCPSCGSPNKARIAGYAVVGALSVLLAAMVVALVLSGHGISTADTDPDTPAGERIVASGADFVWLTDAMGTCEEQARQDTQTLYFLVLPLASLAKDDEQWRAKSIIDIGNAILLRSDDALDGLKSGALRLYSGRYDFRVLDVGANAVYNWKPATGVTKVSAGDASAITQFKLQFQTSGSGDNPPWGDPFNRQTGTCYWVNAIIGK